MTWFWRIVHGITQRHTWSRSSNDLPAGTVFARIDCTRCGFAVDGVASRETKAKLLASGSPRLAAVARRLP